MRSMTTYTKEQVVHRTCLIVVRHIRNHVEEDRGGINTRLFSHILHPEVDYVYAGRSPEVVVDSDIHPEHVVPCAVLVDETRRLIREDKANDKEIEIAQLLQRHWKIAFITKKQARYIDVDLGYKSSMPRGWCFETGDTFERLKLAGITELVPEKWAPRSL